MQNESVMRRVIEQYADMVRRISFLHLQNRSDAEDIFQTVFLKYAMWEEAFDSEEHEKAWLIRVCMNACRDNERRMFHRRHVPPDVIAEEASAVQQEDKEVLRAVLSLPKKYKEAVYLHYYEGYKAMQIAEILSVRENTVYSLLSRGRDMLKETLGGDAE